MTLFCAVSFYRRPNTCAIQFVEKSAEKIRAKINSNKNKIKSKMSVHTVLLDFSINDASRISDEESRKDIIKLFQETLREFFPNLTFLFETSTADGHLTLLSENQKNVFNIRLFDDGIITLNIEYYKKDNEQPPLSFDVSNDNIDQVI